MTVVVKVADNGHVTALGRKTVADRRHRFRGVFGVDGYAYQFRARSRELQDLFRGRVHITRIGVGHGLHDYGQTAAHNHGTDFNRYAVTPGGYAVLDGHRQERV